MRKLTFKIKGWSNYLVFAFLLTSVLGCSQNTTIPESDTLPKSFTDSIPDEMSEWYDLRKKNGDIQLDVRNSTANWEPFTPKNAPEGAPNILFILYDDTGLGAWSPYGGSIKMPTLDSLAARGLTYTQWHTTALCSPTRSTILTGRNHHLNGMASITETADGFPGSNGRVPANCAAFAEVLQDNGYSTFWIGKNHNVPETDVAPGGYRGEWPCQIGFDRFYGFLGGETNNWYPDLVEDNHFVEAPYRPEEGYHLSKDLTEKSIEMLRNQNASNPSKPWYMWFCPGANHAPHHSPKEYTKMYMDEGTFAAGYDKYREEILARMIEMNILPEGTVETEVNFLDSLTVANPQDYITPWDQLSDSTQMLFVRMAEVYAGFSTYTDHEIGKIIAYLKESGQYENTIIIYAADNGASGEGTPNGSVNENKFFNGYPDNLTENMKYMDELGTAATYNHFPTGWAAAFSTPFKMFKRYSQFAGGTNDPLVISWPRFMDSTGVNGELRHQYHHSVDIVPTLLDAIGLEMPDTFAGVPQQPLSGVSMMYTFGDIEANDTTEKKIQYYSMLGTRGIWKEGWKAIALHAPTSGKSEFGKDVWELYHVDEDRSENFNLADSLPDVLAALKDEWFSEAAKNNVLPLDDRLPPDLIGVERPNSEPERDTFVYYPKTTAVPEGVAVNIRGRSYEIIAKVSFKDLDFNRMDDPASGVIFAHGSRFGGHSLFIKDDSLHYVYNFLGIDSFLCDIAAPIPKTLDWHTFKVEFHLERAGVFGEPIGSTDLYINGTKVKTKTMKTQPAKFTLSGDGLCVGYDSADAVTKHYESPNKFTGGMIKYVMVIPKDPSLPPNPEAEARRIMMKQ